MATTVKPYLERVSKLNWNADETARRLGISVPLLHVLRKRHRLYHPDIDMPHFVNCHLNADGKEKKSKPLWSDDKVRLIAFAWQKTPSGVRRFTDNEAAAIWDEICAAIQADYIAIADRKRGYINR